MHATECGAACLGSVLAYFGRWVPLTELRQQCEVSRDGSSAASISRAAKYFGLDCKGMSVRAGLLDKLPLPLILFWQFSHFVVLEGMSDNHYLLNDPATGRRKVTKEQFIKSYSGIALRFAPREDFEKGGTQPNLLKQLKILLAGTWRVLSGVIACGLMLTLLALVIPFALHYFVDDVLVNQGSWVEVVAILLISAVLVYMLSLLKHRFLQRLSVRISVIGYDQNFTRLLRLPVEFFEHRMVGDVSDRVSSIDRVAKKLTNEFLVLIMDMAMSVVLLGAMLLYDLGLAIIVLLLAIAHVGFAYFLNKFQITRNQAMRREQGLLIGVGMQMLSHADNLRMTGSDDRFFSRWSGQQASELRARQSYMQLSSLNSALPEIISALRSAAILAIGGTMVIAGEISLGVLVGFYILAEMFLEPVGRFIGFNDERNNLETDLQRVQDIQSTDEDPTFINQGVTGSANTETITTFNGRMQLAGRVELRDLTYGYNKSRPPLIKDFNLTIQPGQRVAVVGPSGSGKSTLTRLVSGLSQAWSGEILFDNRRMEEIPEEVLRRSISVVTQESSLFAATIRDNITLWNPAVPDDAVISAARDACIHDEILLRPEGYATMVEEGGVNFSGGQRQRLDIARALIGNPTLIILDEATSALDASTEEAVDDNLRRRGSTCLIIAHRLSTVRDCDEIIVLDKGTVIQRGNHEELIRDQDGMYFKLVNSE